MDRPPINAAENLHEGKSPLLSTATSTLALRVADLVRRQANDLVQLPPDYTELIPEQAHPILSVLEARLKADKYLSENCDWERVKNALERNPIALWSVYKMEEKGHMPEVYRVNDRGFSIGTCTAEPPESTRNCVYDAEALNVLKENDVAGAAVENAGAMGVRLVSLIELRMLQAKVKSDKKYWSWVLTTLATRMYNEAIRIYVDGAHARLQKTSHIYHDDNTGWLGTITIPWA